MKKIILLLIPLVAMALILTANRMDESNTAVMEKPGRKVSTIQTSEIQYRPVVFATGKLASKEEVKLSFKTGGIIKKILVSEGQYVRKGQLLAELNLDEIDAKTQQAQMGEKQASIGLDNAELALNIAERDYRNALGLYQDSVATLEQLENAELQLNNARNQLEAAKTNLAFSKQNVTVASFNQTHSRIVAPSSGLILRKLGEANELVGPGNPVFLFGSKDKAQVIRVNITDKDIVNIRLGDQATIEFDAYPEKSFAGTVREIASMADPYINTYEVEVEVSNPQKLQLLSGFIGKVQVFTRNERTLVRIPFSALISANKMSGTVFTVEEGKAIKKEISIFKIENDALLISDGLEVGEEVVVSGGGYLRSDDLVVVNAN
ncbi:MAG: efflux RND transporter periplasmic adaptor subunit [Bacteroidota bacterium]